MRGFQSRFQILKLIFTISLKLHINIIFIVLSCIVLFEVIGYQDITTESRMTIDSMLILIILLSLGLTILIGGANYSPRSEWAFVIILLIIILFLYVTFSVNSLLRFYYFFECTLIPIFVLIMGWGYQPERLSASMYMLFYTLFASLPLLISLLRVARERGTRDYQLLALIRVKIFNPMALFLILAFLVKFPIYYFHLWLPKAHVEAPVSGSIILAGVLLKLGGVGLFMVKVLIDYAPIIIFIFCVSLIGSGFLAVLILRSSDLKVAIAYSSVVHIRMVIVVFMGGRLVGV